ncbi:hypothetical protein ENKO_17130 [Enterobacter kobei]|uniref:Uncharacterized protein n=1 Tax=Enterobacter kobei TaxID=208224 RepID=A0AA86J811_9ENTR|nr:hypothetical protein ENKO_17130 [Enterobacter kobei]
MYISQLAPRNSILTVKSAINIPYLTVETPVYGIPWLWKVKELTRRAWLNIPALIHVKAA